MGNKGWIAEKGNDHGNRVGETMTYGKVLPRRSDVVEKVAKRKLPEYSTV
jgi:hypothetical protein